MADVKSVKESVLIFGDRCLYCIVCVARECENRVRFRVCGEKLGERKGERRGDQEESRVSPCDFEWSSLKNYSNGNTQKTYCAP